MSKQSQPARAPVYGIDLLRFLAASCVVFYHLKIRTFTGETTAAGHVLLPFSDAFYQHSSSAFPQSLAVGSLSGSFLAQALSNNWAWWGFIGVQVFFVISGVVIGYSAERATPRSFVVSRIARLWPAMAICATLIAVLNLAFWAHDPGEELVLYLRSLVFWPAGPWVTGQIWTLPIEIVFYVAVLFLLAAGCIARLDWLAWILAIASAAFWAAVHLGFAEPGRLDALLLLRHGCYFALGIALMQIGTKGHTPALLGLVALCCATAWPEIAAVVQSDFGTDATVTGTVVPYAIWLAAVVFTWASIWWRVPVATTLQRKYPGMAGGLRTVGLATYPLYLVHVQPGAVAMRQGIEGGLTPFAASLLGYAAALVLALIVSLGLEPGLLRAVRRIRDRSAAPGRVSPSRSA